LNVPPGPLAGLVLAGLGTDSMCPDALLEAVAACDAQLAWLSSVRAAVLGSYAALDWSVLGDQWCREQVSVACGIDGGEAFRRISTSLALAERLPATRTALAAGHRGWDFAVAVAQATAGLDPACCRQIELELLGDPALRTSGQVRRAARALALAADPERAAEQGRAARAERCLQMKPGPDGSHEGWFTLPDEQAAVVGEVVDTLAVRQGPDDARQIGARRADALVDLCTFWRDEQAGGGGLVRAVGGRLVPAGRGGSAPGGGGLVPAARGGLITAATSAPQETSPGDLVPAGHGRPAPAAVTITVDLSTVLGLNERPGHLAGGDPILPETARRLACDALLTRLIRNPMTGTVIDLGRAARYPSAAQRRRIEHRDRQCRFPTCERPAQRCHVHHLRTWENGGSTDENNLMILCHRHHQAVHEGGWTVQLRPDNSVAWTPPPYDDLFPAETRAGPGIDHPASPTPNPPNSGGPSPGRPSTGAPGTGGPSTGGPSTGGPSLAAIPLGRVTGTPSAAPDPPFYQPWQPPTPRAKRRTDEPPSALLPRATAYPDEPPF